MTYTYLIEALGGAKACLEDAIMASRELARDRRPDAADCGLHLTQIISAIAYCELLARRGEQS